MLEQERIKKCLNNLHNTLGSNDKPGIYRKSDIDKKLIPFIGVFDLSKTAIYNLSEIETEMIRMYIGIWDDGNTPLNYDIAERTNINFKHVSEYIDRTFNKFYLASMQRWLIDERNIFIKDNIKCDNIRTKILDKHISFIHMPIEYISLLTSHGFKTIGDLLNIDYKDIIKLNKDKKYDYIIIFPRFIVETIHSLGFKFQNEEMFEMLYKHDEAIDEILPDNWGDNLVGDVSVWLRYESDLISFYQFTDSFNRNFKLKNEVGIGNYNILIERLNQYLDVMRKELELLQNEVDEDYSQGVFDGTNRLLCDVFTLKEDKTKKIGKK